MNIALESKWDEFLAQKVTTGAYSSAEEVMEEALQLLRDRDEGQWIDFDAIERLAAPAIADIEAGRYVDLDDEGLKNHAAEVASRNRPKLTQ